MGVDVRQIKMLAEGGMGQILFGDILNLLMRQTCQANDCIIKISKRKSDGQNSRIEECFIQEVSIMYLFRNCVNIAKVFATLEMRSMS